MNTNKKSTSLLIRVPDPFDGSAQTRLARMGVLDKDGRPDPETMRVFSGIFSGQFFEDLCEYYDDIKDLLTILRAFQELSKKQDYQHSFLLLSLQYDYIRKPLPDPVWWLAGDTCAVREFMTQFIRRLEGFVAEAGFLEIAREDESE